MYRGMGVAISAGGSALATPPPSTPTPGWQYKFCSSWFGPLDPQCWPPTDAEIIANNTNVGASMTQANRDAIAAQVALDVANNPDWNHPAEPILPGIDWLTLALVIGGVALFSMVKN